MMTTLLVLVLSACTVYLLYAAVLVAFSDRVELGSRAIATLSLGLGGAAGIVMLWLVFAELSGGARRERGTRSRRAPLVAWGLGFAAVAVGLGAGTNFASLVAFVLLPAAIAFYLLRRSPVITPPAVREEPRDAPARVRSVTARQRRGGRRRTR